MISSFPCFSSSQYYHIIMIRQSSFKKILLQLSVEQLVALILKVMTISTPVKTFLSLLHPDVSSDDILEQYKAQIESNFYRWGKMRRTVRRKQINEIIKEYSFVSDNDAHRMLSLKQSYATLLHEFIENERRAQKYGPTLVKLTHSILEEAKAINELDQYILATQNATNWYTKYLVWQLV